LIEQNKRCAECGNSNEIELHQVFSFDDEDGKKDFLCDDCYEEHEIKGDWVS